MESIFRRRSIRKFENRQVEEEKMHLLLKAAMSAPTARNQREWEFVVVTDKAILKKLAEASPYAKPVEGAPLAIVPLVNKNKLESPAYAHQDLGAATENILIEAEELGLGAVWLGIAPREERMESVSKTLKLPENVEPFAVIAVGYPGERKETEDRYDKEKVHFNKY